jgi:Uma2 family endonuclease
MMSSYTDSISAEQLLRLPDDGKIYELVEGDLRMMSPAGGRHGRVAARLLRKLGNFVEDQQLGDTFAAETGFLLARDPDTVRCPDVAFVSKERLDEAGDVVGYWPGAPDLAIEVVSPTDSYSQVEEKTLAWLDAGCRLVLVVDPQTKTVTVYRRADSVRILDSAASVDGGNVVPGWSLPVAEIFD